jgi:hypothetical protein
VLIRAAAAKGDHSNMYFCAQVVLVRKDGNHLLHRLIQCLKLSIARHAAAHVGEQEHWHGARRCNGEIFKAEHISPQGQHNLLPFALIYEK